MDSSINTVIGNTSDPGLGSIAEKVRDRVRISDEEGVYLFQNGSPGFVGSLANYVREQKHGGTTYFNRNFHIEPTNVCVFSCKFCSYSRLYAHREEGWELSIDQMLQIVKSYDGKPVTRFIISWGSASEDEYGIFHRVNAKNKGAQALAARKSLYRGRTRLYVQESQTIHRRGNEAPARSRTR
jgi:2-iminoacetate synthase ThiH